MQIIVARGLLQELMVCKEAAQPVVEAISKLEHSVDMIDTAGVKARIREQMAPATLGICKGAVQQIVYAHCSAFSDAALASAAT